MTVHKSKVDFDDNAEVVVRGKIGGREVEYSGTIADMTVRVDDGFDEDRYSWKYGTYMPEQATYSFEFLQVDGKAITAKIGKKKIEHRASAAWTKFGTPLPDELDKLREECKAPADATYWISLTSKQITFTWTEEI